MEDGFEVSVWMKEGLAAPLACAEGRDGSHSGVLKITLDLCWWFFDDLDAFSGRVGIEKHSINDPHKSTGKKVFSFSIFIFV